MLSRIFNLLSIAIIVAMLLLTVGAFWVNSWINTSLNFNDDTVLVIQPGDTVNKIGYRLADEGVLTHPRLFSLYARITDRTRIEVGEYPIRAGVTPEQLLTQLQSGNVLTYTVTLVEGKTFKDFLTRLHQQEKIIPTLKGKVQEEIIAELNLSIEHPEGWFYPDTYQYIAGVTDASILLQAHERLKTVLEEEWNNKAEGLPYKNPYEALIMASIVEKETGVPHERSEIAGVFVRRLNKGMRLQTDPTIIYGLGDQYKGNIRRKHLTQPTPYNTYVIDGLPPTPIAMAGRAAIHAALNPKAGETLFFVAKGDGTHYFSKTLAEHNRAVNEYQIKNRAKNYQSAPPK